MTEALEALQTKESTLNAASLSQQSPSQLPSLHKLMLTNPFHQDLQRVAGARALSASMHVICTSAPSTPQASCSWQTPPPTAIKAEAMEEAPTTPNPHLAAQVCYNCKVRKRKCTKEVPSCGLCSKCVMSIVRILVPELT